MANWGSVILKAYEKSQPVLLDGTVKLAKNSRFSLKNPYILESLPDEIIKTASIFEGKKLATVTRNIDNPEFINRYRKFCEIFRQRGNGTFNPNKYLADLYNKLSVRKAKPQLWQDFAKRAESGEFKGSDLYSRIIASEYDSLRLAEYNISNISKNISELTGKSTSRISALEENGWHYRRLKDAPSFSAKYRISINAKGKEDVIKTLDEFVSSERYYKTPDMSGNWLERHDPITIYFKNKPTEAEIKDLINRFEKCNGIRSKEDVLLGTKIASGMAMQTSPSKADVADLIKQCKSCSPDFGKAVEQYLTNVTTKEIKASAGQVEAIENILKAMTPV